MPTSYPTAELGSALGEADYVAVTLPGTPETRRLLDAAAIAEIKQGAYFANGEGFRGPRRRSSRHYRGAISQGRRSTCSRSSLCPRRAPCGSSTTSSSAPTRRTSYLPDQHRTDGSLLREPARYLAEELLNVLDQRLLY